MFVSNVDSGAVLAIPTIVWAARWKTVSTSYSPTARSIRSASQMSPCTTLTRRSVPSTTSAERTTASRLSTVVRAPCSMSALTNQLPSRP